LIVLVGLLNFHVPHFLLESRDLNTTEYLLEAGVKMVGGGSGLRWRARMLRTTSAEWTPCVMASAQAAMERIRRKLAGTDDGNRQMVDILTAVTTDGLPAVEARSIRWSSGGCHSGHNRRSGRGAASAPPLTGVARRQSRHNFRSVIGDRSYMLFAIKEGGGLACFTGLLTLFPVELMHNLGFWRLARTGA
jgi:hypothetical protein